MPRTTPYNKRHLVEYGIRPAEVGPDNKVISAACSFCICFGREKKPGTKRTPTKRIKHFRVPFRSDSYAQHLSLQHPIRWKEYDNLSVAKKLAYFSGASVSSDLVLPEATNFFSGDALEEIDMRSNKRHKTAELTVAPTRSSGVKQLVDQLSTTTSDLCDKYGDVAEYPEVCSVKSYGGHQRFQGFIDVVQCFKDNSMVKQKLTQETGYHFSPDGEREAKVLVVDGGGGKTHALLGDMIAEKAVENGWKGVVVNGCIRDSVAIGKLSLGVLALGTNPRKTVKKGQGIEPNFVNMWDVKFKKGDYLVADEDGIVLLPAEQVNDLRT